MKKNYSLMKNGKKSNTVPPRHRTSRTQNARVDAQAHESQREGRSFKIHSN